MNTKRAAKSWIGTEAPTKKQKQNEQEPTKKRRDFKGIPEAAASLIWPSLRPKFTFYPHKTNVFACPT